MTHAVGGIWRGTAVAVLRRGQRAAEGGEIRPGYEGRADGQTSVLRYVEPWLVQHLCLAIFGPLSITNAVSPFQRA